MDVSYPLHRYSAMISDLARFVGGAEYRLDVLAAPVAPVRPAAPPPPPRPPPPPPPPRPPPLR